MTPASLQLLALARRVAAPHLALPGVCAAMVTGSVAKGVADHYSDIDMAIFYEAALPDAAALDQIRADLGSPQLSWASGSHAEGTLIQAFDQGGVEVQLIHTTVAAWEATMAEVLTELKVDTPLHKALEGILICRPLFGDTRIAAWKARAAAFPPALGEAMARHYLRFFPAWGLQPYLAGRDATIWYYQTLVESAHNLLGALAGLNHVYFTPFQFKRASSFAEQLLLAPPQLAARIDSLFRSPLSTALPELERLVDETTALIARHMPQVDVSAARRRIGWRRAAWAPPEDLAS